ncbi:MAG TPA: ribonuclease J [Erysipelothrix sp.]
MENIKFFALGGLDENGRNMSVIEIDQEMYIIDVGLKYPENEQLGIQAIIPDFSYIIENKEKVKGIFITHGHDDVMGALPYLVEVIDAPIYATPLIELMIEDMFKKHNVKAKNIKRIKRNSKFKLNNREIVTFGLTHSIPDAVGIAIKTDQGYIVHSGEFIMDFNTASEAFNMNLTSISELGRKGVFALLSESVSAGAEGFTSPNHRIEDTIDRVFEDEEERIIVTLYEQNIYRLIEVIEVAKRYKRKLYFYGEKQRMLMRHLEKLNYFSIPKGMLLSPKEFNNDYKNVVIVVSDVGPNVFRKMARIAMGEDQLIEINPEDTVIMAAPVVPGTEKLSSEVVNELYKEGVKVISIKAESMHASQEDLKMMIALLKPKYYIPIKGSYQRLNVNADLAHSMGIHKDKIIILDNGQIANFKNGELVDTTEIIKEEQILIDGNENLDASGLVLRDRQILATDGSIIVGIVLDQKTKKVIGGPDIQSRGVIYLKDARNLMNQVGKILQETIEEHVKANEYKHIDTRNEARKRISRFIQEETGKRPMVMPVIIEIRQ